MSWDKLSMADRAAYIKLGVENGITDLNTIRSIYNKYAEGGDLESSKPKNVTLLDKIKLGLAELDEEYLGRIMLAGQKRNPKNLFKELNVKDRPNTYSKRVASGGTAQRTYLLPRWEQEEIFKRDGYIKGKEDDYGLVKKAVGDRDIPIWQVAEDAINRENLIPIGNDYRTSSAGRTLINRSLVHAGSYPSTYYVDNDLNNIYIKSWDLNDYGGGSGHSRAYKSLRELQANLVDAVGNPVVVTTGFQPVVGYPNTLLEDKPITVKDVFNSPLYESLGNMLDTTMKKKGLVRTNLGTTTNPDWKYTLPEVTITGKRKRRRGK